MGFIFDDYNNIVDENIKWMNTTGKIIDQWFEENYFGNCPGDASARVTVSITVFILSILLMLF